MTVRTTSRLRRGPATVIVTLFLLAVSGAASLGWWYARDSPPHQGPIVLISVDRLAPAAIRFPSPARPTAIDALVADSVVFERAYGHSPLLLPSHASMLSGQLPPDHGVRDEAGFALREDVRTLAEHLRNRGFRTGAAVSSFLLRPETGVARGFGFFDADLPAGDDQQPAIERSAAETLDAAERWIESQSGQRFFLFVQVDAPDAELTVTRLAHLLKRRNLYQQATIVLVGDRGEAPSLLTLDDAALHVPLVVKQPAGQGSGRRISVPVQHIDLLPTILDLVRAPMPGRLRGRSLRPLLDSERATLPDEPIYAESLAAYFRIGGTPLMAVTGGGLRYLRGSIEELFALDAGSDGADAGASADMSPLRQWLDDLLAGRSIGLPSPVAAADEPRLARLGYLPGLVPEPGVPLGIGADDERALVEAQSEAASLVGQGQYPAAVRVLRRAVREYPGVAAVQHQLATLLARVGRLQEAAETYQAVVALRPHDPEPLLGLMQVRVQQGQHDAAREHATRAVELAEASGRPAAFLARAHEMAMHAALARHDGEAASAHAKALEALDPAAPATLFVRGRQMYDDARYEEAADAFAQADALASESGRTLAGLHLYYGETLAQLDRSDDAERQFRKELRAFPLSIQAYTSLAMLYHASNQHDAVEETLDALVAAAPTPDGYGAAARVWTVVGRAPRADALRAEARARFRGSPALALLGRDARR